MLYGTMKKRARQRLADGVGGLAAIVRTLHAAVLRDRPEPVDHAPLGHPREKPEEQVELRPTGGQEDREQHDLTTEDAQRVHAAGVVAQTAEQTLQVLPTTVAEQVAAQLAAHRRAGDRIAVVEVHVGFVRPELVLVVGHVTAPVQVGRRERRIAEHPAPDEVVDALVREQQTVRGLVGEAGESRRTGAP